MTSLRLRGFSALLLLATTLLAPRPASAQPASPASPPATGFSTPASPFGRLDGLVSNAAAFRFARPGEATTRVYVWGAVAAPGLYEVTQGTDLSALVALAGGPATAPVTRETRQRTVVRLYRTDGPVARRLVYEADVAAFVVGAPSADGSALGGPPPVPADGDVVEVTTYTERIRTWRDDLSVVGGVAAIVVAVTQVVNLLVR